MTSPFQPPTDDPTSGSDALADLEAAFDAQGDPADILVIEEEPPPVGRSWAFDFSTAQFVRRGGGPLETHGDATLILWAEKCLRTARGAHPIHPPGYGLVRPFDLIGRLVAGAPVAELEERIREALTFNPRIGDIADFSWDLDEDNEAVAISFSLVLADDSRLSLETVLPLTPTGARVA